MYLRLCCLLTTLLLLAASQLPAAEILWTRMTGQYPVESAPLVADIDQDGTQEIVAVNRIGQVMRWGPGGEDRGPGQDGTVLQLPEAGIWSSSPTFVAGPNGPRVLLASEKGLVVALDKNLTRILWQHQLAGRTEFAHAVPAVLPAAQGQEKGISPIPRNGPDGASQKLAPSPVSTGLCFADHTGTITCLGVDGGVLWKTELKTGKCATELQILADRQSPPILLAPCGSSLHGIGPDGRILWSQDLKREIQARPELLVHDGKTIVVCGGKGLAAVNPQSGGLQWTKELACEIDGGMALLPVTGDRSRILHTSRWGDLYVRDAAGDLVSQSLFRSKTRSRPLVWAPDGNDVGRIFVTAYNQHLYEFDARGRLRDDIRLSGTLNAPPVLIQDPGQKQPDLLIVTATLLAYRIHPGEPRSPYGETGKADKVAMRLLEGKQRILVENPQGALVRVSLSSRTERAGIVMLGVVTARSRFELPFPDGAIDLHATVEDARGRILGELNPDSVPPRLDEPLVASNVVHIWAEPAYASFDETRLVPQRSETAGETPAPQGTPGPQGPNAVEIHNLYQNEIDQGAFVAVSILKEPLRARVTVSPLATADKKPFTGRLTLREVVSTGTVNGERAADALPALGDAGLLTLPPRRATKIWISVDAHGANPGVYEGQITLQPLWGEPAACSLPIHVEVLKLALDKDFPLALCTWDYVPNNWFPNRTPEVLDDMARHGVNVWPRTDCTPPARLGADGRLVLDWTKLDATLELFRGRGRILFQVSVPPITFATSPTPEAKRQVELAYFRSWRDHLRERGWDYADYAFYPVDEPGLDHGKSLHVLVDAAKLVREADPKLRIYTDPVPGLSWADFQRIEPLIDVWCPNMRLAGGLLSHDPRIRRILDSNKTLWSYECVSQVKSLSPLRYNRANAWRAEYFGLQGIGFWTHSTTNIDHWLPGKTINDEYALVYPGLLPVPSVRWEAVRDGLEDIAAMALLKRAIADHKHKGTRLDLVGQAEAALRIARTDILELSDEAFVESRDFLRAGDRRLWHTLTDVDTYCRHRARIAELTRALLE